MSDATTIVSAPASVELGLKSSAEVLNDNLPGALRSIGSDYAKDKATEKPADKSFGWADKILESAQKYLSRRNAPQHKEDEASSVAGKSSTELLLGGSSGQ